MFVKSCLSLPNTAKSLYVSITMSCIETAKTHSGQCMCAV